MTNNLKDGVSVTLWARNLTLYIDGEVVMPKDGKWHHFAIVADGHYGYIDEVSIKEGKDVPIKLEGINTKALLHFNGNEPFLHRG